MRSWRRWTSLLAVSLATCVVVPARAATPETLLRAGATFHTTGSSGFRVQARDGFEVDPEHAPFTLRYDGSWAAFMVVSRASLTSHAHEYELGVLEEPAPAGCAAGGHGARCPDGKGLDIFDFWPESASHHGTALNPYSGTVLHYPPGRYDVYLLTEPGKHLTVSWRTGQRAPGQTARPRSQPVRTSYEHTSVPGTKLTATTSGTVQQRLLRTGLLHDYLWASNQPDSQLENDESSLCVEGGESQPDLVAPRGDTCATLDQNDPSFMASGGGAGGSTYGFSVSGVLLNGVRPGLFWVPYSIRMTGLDPQVGSAMLAWEYLV